MTGLSRQTLGAHVVPPVHTSEDVDALVALTAGFPGLVVRCLLSNWRSASDTLPFEVLDGVAAMFQSLDSSERIILKKLAVTRDTLDVMKSAPQDKLSYLRMIGLVSPLGALVPEIVRQYADTPLSVEDVEDAPKEVLAFSRLREIELTLRRMIRRAVDDGRIPPTCFESALKSESDYAELVGRKRRLRFGVTADDCEAALFPQLSLVIKSHYGSFTRDLSMERKAFNRVIEILNPFRNDQFHFHDLPEVEFKRAEVAMLD